MSRIRIINRVYYGLVGFFILHSCVVMELALWDAVYPAGSRAVETRLFRQLLGDGGPVFLASCNAPLFCGILTQTRATSRYFQFWNECGRVRDCPFTNGGIQKEDVTGGEDDKNRSAYPSNPKGYCQPL